VCLRPNLSIEKEFKIQMQSEVRIQELTIEKNQLIATASALLDQGDMNQYRAVLKEVDALTSTIDSLNQIQRMLGRNTKPESVPAAITAPTVTATLTSEQRAANRNRAYRHLLRNGYKPGAFEQRDITVSNTDGALVSQDFDKAYIAAQKWAGPIATLVKYRKVAGSGAPTKFTITDDTASTMTYLSETSNAAGAEAEPSMSSTVPGTDTLVTLVKYSFQELDDANDIEGFIRDLAFVRASRAAEYALTLGKDNGTETQLPNSPTGGLLGSVGAGVTQSAGQLAAGPTYAQLANLAGSVDHAYYAAPNSGFMASPSVFNLLVSQTDTTGRPLYAFNEDGLLVIAGKPLYVNNAMPAYNAASSPVVLFGDYSRRYAYLDGGGLQIKILAERFADTLEGAAVIYQRLGAANLVPNSVKSLVSAAS
jgi:HK97 family phage major capsid protein